MPEKRLPKVVDLMEALRVSLQPKCPLDGEPCRATRPVFRNYNECCVIENQGATDHEGLANIPAAAAEP